MCAAEITVTGGNLYLPFVRDNCEKTIQSSSLLRLKDRILNTALTMCVLNYIRHGEIDISVVFTKDGEYFDSDECRARVSEDYGKIEIID